MANTGAPPAIRLTTVHWLICFVASMGFAFDIYAILVLPLVVAPALGELGQLKPGTPEYNHWTGLLFFVPAIAGGFFGLIGGYLTDLWGRQKVLVVSILLYAFSAVAAGYANSLEMFLFLRCTTFIGVCVEFVAAVAWLAELFPNPKQRESVLGYTQAFSSVGGLLAAGTNALAVAYAASLPAIYGGHSSWRYTLIAGVIPAIPLMIIRPFLPESPEWARKKKEGTLKRPSIGELFQPAYLRTTVVTALMFACSYGAAFGAIQHLPRIVPGLPEAAGLARPAVLQMANKVQSVQEIGGLVGRVVLAFLAIRIVSRKNLLRVFQLPGLLIVPLVFYFPAKDNLQLLQIGVFLAGLVTVAQFSFWGNYLPRVYPLHLRGTGESFAANVGGRMLGTSAAYVTTTLANYTSGTSPSMKLANAAAIVALFSYALGTILCSFLPEPEESKMRE
ncbi:MAG: MFS transporter [Acidobacteria bacterium]|nr:MFS transporter [Acidobacteriota bacterium]